MTFTLGYIVIGAVLIVMALSASVLKRLPLSTAMLYLAVGVVIGPHGFGLVHIDPMADAAALERITEVAVIVSLFSAGLKLRVPLRDPLWRLPVVLATGSMVVTVGLIGLVAHLLLGLPIGAAILMGGLLAPTDPVLASDVQVTGPRDRDRLRFTLTGEAGLNDGSAFPFVMLGLGLLGLHDLGESGWRWLAVDVVWAVTGGLAIGALLGMAMGRLILHLRRQHREAIGLDDFIALGLIALSYGVAVILNAYGFLAVFAAGLALRKIEEWELGAEESPEDMIAQAAATGDEEAIATDEKVAPAYMAQAVLGFTEQLERIGEVAVMILIGAMLTWEIVPAAAIWFVPLLFFIIRPAAVGLGTIGSATSPLQRAFIAWFGVRGIGSIYYLMYAIEHAISPALGRLLLGMTLAVVTVSVLVHGISVTPLMSRYGEVADGNGAE
ncbi:MAG: sodium:proton antiporter [Thermomicrobiales bacterium]